MTVSCIFLVFIRLKQSMKAWINTAILEITFISYYHAGKVFQTKPYIISLLCEMKLEIYNISIYINIEMIKKRLCEDFFKRC